MENSEVAFLSAAATARAVRAGELTPTQAVQAYLERIDRMDSRLSAFITVTREEALGEARDVEGQLQLGRDPGPLAGVPMAIKDQFLDRRHSHHQRLPGIPGLRSQRGRHLVVRRLRNAGATLLGKTQPE